MKHLRIAAILALSTTLLATDCDEADDLVGADELFGDFGATRVEFISDLDSDVRDDLIADGASFTLLIDEDGEFVSILTDGDGRVLRRTGTIRIRADLLVFSDDPFLADDLIEPRFFEFTRIGDRLFLTDRDAEFDFDDDGLFDAAILEVDLELL